VWSDEQTTLETLYCRASATAVTTRVLDTRGNFVDQHPRHAGGNAGGGGHPLVPSPARAA